MNNRYTPFGYCIRDGKTTVVSSEAEVITKIYSLYLSGESLKTIAALLTYEKVEFLPDRWNWNKNRIVRILDDTRYIGTERYASIISADVYQQAQDIKLSRNTQTGYDRTRVISTSVVPIICGKCGCSTKRSLDKRRKDAHRYTCDNPHCHEIYHISEEAMIQMIGNLMDSASVTVISPSDLDSLSDIQRLEREIARSIEYYNGGFSEIEAMIHDCVNKKYQTKSSGRADSDKLKHHLENERFQVNRRTVAELVSRIRLLSDNDLELTLINGQILRKGLHDGTDHPADEKCQGDFT